MTSQIMSKTLTNEEIRQELLKLNFDCGPVTGTTREIYLKKLESLRSNPQDKKRNEANADEELRSQLISFGEPVAPITEANRHIYLKRLEKIKKSKVRLKPEIQDDTVDDDYKGWEPMEID